MPTEEDLFGDLLLIRKGGPEMEQGGGPTTIEPAVTPAEWEVKAQALREIFRQTLGEDPRIDCPLSLQVDYEKDRGDHIERRVSYMVAPDERVASLALIPKGLSRPAPGLLCIHPTQEWGKEELVGGGGGSGEPLLRAPPRAARLRDLRAGPPRLRRAHLSGQGRF